MSRKLILVTGMPRSGTTAIGERLVRHKAIELYEPMNVHVGDVSIRHQFTLLGEDGFDEAKLDRFLGRARNGFLFGKYPPRNSPRHPIFNRTRRTMLRSLIDRRARTLIWKDPFAVFLAADLPPRGIPVVVTVRDPLACAASFQRMSWSFNTTRFQERMRALGKPSINLPEPQGDVREETASAARLWFLTHQYLLSQLQSGANLTLIAIEDNLTAPDSVARRLEAATGLEVASVETKQLEAGKGETLSKVAHIKNRSTDSITKYWQKVLSDDEVSYVRHLNDDLYDKVRPWLS